MRAFSYDEPLTMVKIKPKRGYEQRRMMMTTSATNATEREALQDKPGKSQIIVVDLEKPQTPQQVKRLRKGRGNLMTRIERIVRDLVSDGTVKSGAESIVVVVREQPPMPWPSFGNLGNFGSFGKDDDDDDDDDDDHHVRVVRVG
jgi:hypothetical protein